MNGDLDHPHDGGWHHAPGSPRGAARIAARRSWHRRERRAPGGRMRWSMIRVQSRACARCSPGLGATPPAARVPSTHGPGRVFRSAGLSPRSGKTGTSPSREPSRRSDDEGCPIGNCQRGCVRAGDSMHKRWAVHGLSWDGTASASAGTPAGSSGGQQTRPPSLLVSITLSPAPRASTDVLATAARLIGQRAARLGLQYTQAKVSGQNVVLTGPAADEAELKTLAAAAVLRLRQVLLQAPSPGSTASGDASLVQPRVLALFRKLACGPGGSDTAWKSEIGYTASSDWDNPNAETVSCDSSGDKYALAAAKVLGQDVTSAAATPATVANQWAVDLTLNSAGTSAFAELTTDLHSKYPLGEVAGNQNDMTLDQVAVVVDGSVISAPDHRRPDYRRGSPDLRQSHSSLRPGTRRTAAERPPARRLPGHRHQHPRAISFQPGHPPASRPQLPERRRSGCRAAANSAVPCHRAPAT